MLAPNAAGGAIPAGTSEGPPRRLGRAPKRLPEPHGKLHTMLSTAWRFARRIDVCWSFLFFVYLVCVAALTTSITQTKITSALLEDLHNIHNTRIQILTRRMSQETERAFGAAAAFLSLHSQQAFAMGSEDTLATLCSTLAAFDTSMDFRSLAVTSLELREAIVCFHDDQLLGSSRQLYGWMTNKSVINGVYLVDNATYKFQRPLVEVYGGWPKSAYNLTQTYIDLNTTDPLFTSAADYYDGITNYVDYRTMWRAFPSIPHILYFNIPAGYLYRGLNLSTEVNVTDYVDVRVDGSKLVVANDRSSATSITTAVFINASLASDDPLIMSNNWGQPSVNDTEIITPDVDTPVSYLKVSNVSSPLMRAALKHVDFKKLQQLDSNHTHDFQFEGAPASVTALMYTTTKGLVVPLVLVSAHAVLTPPYRRLMNICNGVNGIAILLLTALFWLFLNRQLRFPLRHMTALLLQSAKRGTRVLFRTDPHSCLTLTEVQQLADAHNAAMRQLREIDTFIPRAVREEMMLRNSESRSLVSLYRSQASSTTGDPRRQHAKHLRTHLSTVVYLSIRPRPPKQRASQDTTLPNTADAAPQNQRLVNVVASAARKVAMVNSGPFSSPAALNQFAEKVYELCEGHQGTVLRLCPDGCIVHFYQSVRSHLLATRQSAPAVVPTEDHHATSRTESAAEPAVGTEARRRAMQDALAATSFTLALQRWLDESEDAPAPFPEVRALLDTSLFTCGHYRARGSDQAIPMAVGRDVQRELGRVPLAIGVRIAMTEETAGLVRFSLPSCPRGVRQLPVEAICVGRPGLDEDVIVLYELLPGHTEGDMAWQRYQRCCFDAFTLMVRGDYAGALCAYNSVADIADLERGLMPQRYRREVPTSDAAGGAVSTQVSRLMRECERCIRSGVTEGFFRRASDPLGVDAVLHNGAAASREHEEETHGAISTRNPSQSPAHSSHAGHSTTTIPHFMHPKAETRYVVDLNDGGRVVRTVLPSAPEWVQGSCGLIWRLSQRPIEFTPAGLWKSRRLALGSAGALATINFLAFRDVPSIVTKAIKDAPAGAMSDALRSAVPVCDPTPQQNRAVHMLNSLENDLQHPNLLTPIGYSLSTEGTVTIIWEFFAGGTLRSVAARYDRIKPITAARLMFDVLSGLVYLHQRGTAHGALQADNVMVGANGFCRLYGHCVNYPLRVKTLVIPRTTFVSPHMAAGAAPTPACDIFCYGLMYLEVLSRDPVWRWAPVPAGQPPQRSEEELRVLMEEAGPAFYKEVMQGGVVPNTAFLEELALSDPIIDKGAFMLLRCLSPDASKRPTAVQVLLATKHILTDAGIEVQDYLLDE